MKIYFEMMSEISSIHWLDGHGKQTTMQRADFPIVDRNWGTHQASSIEVPNFSKHRSSNIVFLPNFTVHRPSTIGTLVSIGHRPSELLRESTIDHPNFCVNRPSTILFLKAWMLQLREKLGKPWQRKFYTTVLSQIFLLKSNNFDQKPFTGRMSSLVYNSWADNKNVQRCAYRS